MIFNKDIKVKHILSLLFWVLIGSGTIVLLVSAVINNNKVRRCSGLNISINGSNNKLFIDDSEVRRVIAQHVGGNVTGRPISEFKLQDIEEALKKDIWIKEAKLYFDNNEKFRVNVVEREPVARIFTQAGSSYYIDSSLMTIPLSELFSARLPVFTGFPSELRVLTKRDSVLLKDISILSMKIQGDPLLMAFIDQTEITSFLEFEMTPKIGNQVIIFGDASDADEKFEKMKLFYKSVMLKTGWGRYSRISLKYKGQVVATLRGKKDLYPDSLRATQLLQIIADNADKMSSDSATIVFSDAEKNNSDVSLVQQNFQRDDNGSSDNTIKAVSSDLKKSLSPTPLKISKIKNTNKSSVSLAPQNKTKAVMPQKKVIKTKNL